MRSQKAGRVQTTQRLAGSGKKSEFYYGFTGMPTKDFKQQKERVYDLKRLSWQLCGRWIQGDKSGNGETSQETVDYPGELDRPALDLQQWEWQKGDGSRCTLEAQVTRLTEELDRQCK